MNIYELTRRFWDYSYDNPTKIKPAHAAIYFFAIEHSNRLGWKEVFGFPSSVAMEATGIRSYKTYISMLNDLIDFGFIVMVERSKNQYTSNIIALVKNTKAHTKAHTKALDKAIIKHMPKQHQSTDQSIDSIDIPIYNTTNTPINKYTNEAVSCLSNESEEQKKMIEFRESDFFKKICNYFSQNTEALQMKVFGDMWRVRDSGQFSEFKRQTNAYIDYKSKTGEIAHRWQNYIAEWKNDNWIDRLQKAKNGDPKKVSKKQSWKDYLK